VCRVAHAADPRVPDDPVPPPHVARLVFRKPCGAWLSRPMLSCHPIQGAGAGDAMAVSQSGEPVAANTYVPRGLTLSN
jgi:hypothetical protein